MYIIKEVEIQLDPKKIKANPIPKDLKKKWTTRDGVDNPDYKKWIKLHWAKESVETTKGGKGPTGSHVKAPGGEYIHSRKHDPDKYTDYRTIKKNGKLLRLGKTKDGKWEVQSVLTKESIDRPIAENVSLEDGIYEGYFYSWILEINETKYPTLYGVRCTKEHCGGLTNIRIESKKAYI